jgi:cellulose synthase/poly-beta-1,6-N-acetylglucosamine synthase-like glycosyltransferase
VISAYYWLIHPIILLALLKFRRAGKHENPPICSEEKLFKKILIIPTFGSRKAILSKLDSLEKLLKSNLFEEIDHIYIVYSEPSQAVLRELEQKLSGSPLREKTSLIIEEERRGKAYAINHALKLAYENYGKDLIVIVNDDDAFFTQKDLEKLLSCFKNKIAVACIYPSYQEGVLNIFYKYKRFIHNLEAKLCNPVIGGELMAFRTDVITYLRENSLSEDLQTSLLAEIKGHNVKLINGQVTENYPTTISGIKNRTKRVVLGTILEYMAFFKSLNKTCKYIYGAYTFSLISLPLLLFSMVTLFLYGLLVINSLTVYLITLLFIVISLYFFRSAIKFVTGILIGTVDAFLIIVKSKYSQNFSNNIKELWQENKDLEYVRTKALKRSSKSSLHYQ